MGKINGGGEGITRRSIIIYLTPPIGISFDFKGVEPSSGKNFPKLEDFLNPFLKRL